ncbi:MAG: hypothetical protein ACLQGN_11790 [Mycobacterium sp.]|uniref:hypothetical protein n=1 Tax=Mycobacterium sp. TaxID=1785 RepID=UPI003F9C2BF8
MAALTTAEDIEAGRISPADLDQAAADECRKLFGTVAGPDDPLWSLHVDIARQVLAKGGIPVGELTEWVAVARSRTGGGESGPPATPAEREAPPKVMTPPSPFRCPTGRTAPIPATPTTTETRCAADNPAFVGVVTLTGLNRGPESTTVGSECSPAVTPPGNISMWITMAFPRLGVDGQRLAVGPRRVVRGTGDWRGWTDGACPMNTEATGVAWSNGTDEMVQGA